MTARLFYRIFTVFLAAAPLVSANILPAADPDAPIVVAKPLFDSHDVLDLTLSVDFDSMCRPNEVEDCPYTPTTMTYKSADGDKYTIPVEIRVRGGWRARKSHCSVPPLFMRFSAVGVKGTPFAGQGLLPLTTHCRSRKSLSYGDSSSADYEQYVLKEYIGYRLYNIISDRSLRVRLARITYRISGKRSKSTTRYAFFAEHFDDMAARQRAEVLPWKSFDYKKIDLTASDQVALFNFMIGNTDWSIVRQRNTVLIATGDGRQYPVPFDLDMSGLVDAEYAGVSPRLDFRDVRQRYYLGFCHPQTDFEDLFAEFQDHRNEIMALVGDTPGLRRSTKKAIRRYLDKFFHILESPERREKSITDACHLWPPAPDDHTTPPAAS